MYTNIGDMQANLAVISANYCKINSKLDLLVVRLDSLIKSLDSIILSYVPIELKHVEVIDVKSNSNSIDALTKRILEVGEAINKTLQKLLVITDAENYIYIMANKRSKCKTIKSAEIEGFHHKV